MDNKEKAEGEDISKNKSPLVVDNQNPIAEETYTKEISKLSNH